MFGYPTLRKVNIPSDERDMFDRIGEVSLQLTLAGGFNPRSQELTKIYENAEYVKHAQEWLTERADEHARREWRMERVEWAVLIFVFIGVIVDCVLVFKPSAHC